MSQCCQGFLFYVWRGSAFSVIQTAFFSACPLGWVNMGNPLLQPPRNLFMDSRNMPEKYLWIPIMGSATVSLLKIAIFSTYGMQ